MDWLHIHRGAAPLIVSIPHAGTEIPPAIETRLVSPWLARKDADWFVDRLYAFAPALGATVVRTAISRTVIDVNRDPSGASLYPGAATTGLCPATTFDGEALYRGEPPDDAEIAERRRLYFDRYHGALAGEIARLSRDHGAVVLFEAHSIRSVIPRLFEGPLPNFNIGTNDGRSCAPALTARVEAACDGSGLPRVTNARFKGGWTTRRYGNPAAGVHALQLELACRGYMTEPAAPIRENWPPSFDAHLAAPMIEVLTHVLEACLDFLPPLHGEGQAAKRPGWGSNGQSATTEITHTSPPGPEPVLGRALRATRGGHPPHEGEGGRSP